MKKIKPRTMDAIETAALRIAKNHDEPNPQGAEATLRAGLQGNEVERYDKDDALQGAVKQLLSMPMDKVRAYETATTTGESVHAPIKAMEQMQQRHMAPAATVPAGSYDKANAQDEQENADSIEFLKANPNRQHEFDRAPRVLKLKMVADWKAGQASNQ